MKKRSNNKNIWIVNSVLKKKHHNLFIGSLAAYLHMKLDFQVEIDIYLSRFPGIGR